MATEIELQTVRWIAELLGFPVDSGGLLVSGGNVANLVGFWAGRRVKTPWDLRREGYGGARPRPRVYASRETHTWIEKAVDLSGMGSEAIRWIPTSSGQRLDPDELARAVARDRAAGDLPLLAVGTAGTVSTGAVDPLREIAAVCREHDLWFHVDGAYGGPAAILADADPEYAAIADADSVAVDPHKWLYAPLEAGCALVRDREALRDTFAYHPPYYPAIEGGEEPPVFFHELGPQNSRGFRALKVWLGLRLAGRDGLARTIGEDVELARALHREVARHPELEAGTCSLSITTFRFVPADLRAPARAGDEAAATYLDRLNEELVQRLMSCGELFVSNAVVDGAFWLRACIVNFRTTAADVGAIPEIVARHGRALDATLRPAAAGGAAGARPAG
jgi:glutamate/tyrosine decarboxylase-like PLP-dependent enzyme